MVLSKLCTFEGINKKRLCFHSDTDTEVLVNLIEEIQKKEGEQTWESSTNCGNHTYATLIKTRVGGCTMGSPLAIGIGEVFFTASDASPHRIHI
jgi:glucosamine--fructose-6-phosphate aminotransferase (isomerizing)